MQVQVIPDSQTRQREESQIVVRCLARLHDCLPEQSTPQFDQAISRTQLSNEQLKSGEGLTQEHFDIVLDYLRRDISDIIFRFMSRIELTDLGILGYAVLSCPSVGQGLGILARYLELTSDRFVEEHEIKNGFHIIRPQPTWRHMGITESIAEDSLGGNWRALQLMMGPNADFSGASIRLAYEPPSHRSVYEEFFSPCEVSFNTGQSELVIPAAWLELPISSANVIVSDLTRAMCERLLGPGHSPRADTARTVRRLLLSRPGKHMLSLEDAAELMRMSTAQLRKRLYRSGTSYKSIVLEVRMNLARHYLESTHLSIKEIAYLLDYAQPGPFSRAFKKYFGHPPKMVRLASQEIS